VFKPGDAAPVFHCIDDENKAISLADFKGRNLILYFYPKADTTGCTHEAVEFSSAIEQFSSANTAIVGCSGDSVESQAKFKVKYSLNFPLLADTEFDVIEAYGARRMKTFFGKSFLGIVRMSFWIGPDGKIQKVWEKVTPKGHAAEVLAAVRGLAQIERSA
jgi:thioredoxin-dependent peroxiredoxin